jgi:hypothetical protein
VHPISIAIFIFLTGILTVVVGYCHVDINDIVQRTSGKLYGIRICSKLECNLVIQPMKASGFVKYTIGFNHEDTPVESAP